MSIAEKKRTKSPKNRVSRFCDYLRWLYLQWCLITGLYMLEPWEQCVFNTFVVGLVSFLLAIFYVFIQTPIISALSI